MYCKLCLHRPISLLASTQGSHYTSSWKCAGMQGHYMCNSRVIELCILCQAVLSKGQTGWIDSILEGDFVKFNNSLVELYKVTLKDWVNQNIKCQKHQWVTFAYCSSPRLILGFRMHSLCHWTPASANASTPRGHQKIGTSYLLVLFGCCMACPKGLMTRQMLQGSVMPQF